jgi:hypothetical protein
VLIINSHNFGDDAERYISAVEAADGAPLPAAIVAAIENFIDGCKADGIWDAIKASCLLAGPATLAGSLVPLKGADPTNVGFVGADHNQLTGLKGNESSSGFASERLVSNRGNTDDPQNNRSLAVYVSEVGGTVGNKAYAGSPVTTGSIGIRQTSGTGSVQGRASSDVWSGFSSGVTQSVGFCGVSRSVASEFRFRAFGNEQTVVSASSTPQGGDIQIFAYQSRNHYGGRLSFYSIGESLNLAALDSRVSTYMTEIAL